MLIRNAWVWAHGPADVRITGDGVIARAPGLRPLPGEPVLDAAGGTLLPGLHDHHIHLRALAAAAVSIPAGPPEVTTAGQLSSRLRNAHQTLPIGRWARCVGYHESVAGPLDRWALDLMLASRPVRVQHRTGMLWMLNSVAVRQLRLDDCDEPGVERDPAGRVTGRLWRMDGWLGDRLPGTVDLAAVSAQAAAWGITGFTDATPGESGLTAAVVDGTVRQRVHGAAGTAAHPRFTLGPVKILLDDATLPPLDDLAGQIRAAHAAGRPVAVHCVTRVQLALTLAALADAGRRPGDRIEHGAVIPAESVADLRGLTVVTQPHFVTERADQYLSDVAVADRPDLWRLRSLLDAGVAVALGSDAPYGSADPWAVIRAATARPAGLDGGETIPAATAIGLFLGEPAAPGIPRTVTPGRPADLTLLTVPPAEAARAPSADLVAATFVAGQPIYQR